MQVAIEFPASVEVASSQQIVVAMLEQIAASLFNRFEFLTVIRCWAKLAHPVSKFKQEIFQRIDAESGVLLRLDTDFLQDSLDTLEFVLLRMHENRRVAARRTTIAKAKKLGNEAKHLLVIRLCSLVIRWQNFIPMNLVRARHCFRCRSDGQLARIDSDASEVQNSTLHADHGQGELGRICLFGAAVLVEICGGSDEEHLRLEICG